MKTHFQESLVCKNKPYLVPTTAPDTYRWLDKLVFHRLGMVCASGRDNFLIYAIAIDGGGVGKETVTLYGI